MANSGVFPIFLRAEYKNDGKGFEAFQSEAARAAQAAKREFQGVGAALDAALSRGRTSGGALDLGVDELRRAAQEQQRLAAAAREVAEASRRAATANGGFDASLSRATKSAFEFANAQDRASREMFEQIALLDRVQRELNQTASATNAAAAATQRNAVVSGQARQGMQQLGFQIGDIATMYSLGAKPAQIFASQIGQVTQAIQLMSGSTSRLANFLGGPWGIALTAATIVTAPFVAKLFEAEEATELAKTGADNLAAAQSVLGGVFDEVSGKLKTQNELLILNARLTALNLRSEALAKGASARATFTAAGQRSTGDRFFGGGVSDTAAARTGIAPRQSRGQNNAATVRALLEGVKAGRISADEALKRSERLDFTGTGATAEQFRQAIIDQAFSKDAARVAELIDQSLNSGSLAPELRRDRKTRTRSGRSAADKAAREAERLATFGEDAAEAIARLNERFDEQPRLVDAAAQATRQLDAIIRDLSERKPANFEALIADAEKAKGTVQSALVRPFEELRQESEQRLQVETLLAQGREDEAAALQEVIRLERQIGTVTAEQRAEVEAIVRAEAERTRYLRDQQRLFLAQLDVVDQVQRSLTDVLSGRSADFFGDFRQALQDLQGQRLFEDIFGQAFRDIRDELQALSPQGKANAAFAAEVERTAAATATVGDAALSLAEQFDRAFGIVGAAANRSLATVGGANDNPPLPMNEIVVTARRQPEVRIARMSVMELANRLGASIGAGLGAQLEDVFGPRFAEVFGEIAGGAIAGKVTGGNVGALFGGATKLLESGVLGNDNRISEKFGKATEGAAIGSQVAAIGKALGIKGSTTGAQLGGALGSFIPIPGGNIIGAIAGNLLGGLLKKTPRASATIGGVGGGLGLSSVTGTSASLRDAANNLGGSVLEAVNRIAEQLGASLNAGAGSVSIGQRKGNLRVDPAGRGVTKLASGAVDFGDDAEAAIAFAVRDLIQDGVITGLKASEQRLLRAGNDIEAALRDVLTFRDVFDRLKAIKDPIGAAIDAVTKEFEAYRDVFRRAGADAAELATLEELAGLERARAIEDATNRVVGSLKSLLDGLRFGDSGLSLRTRQGNAASRFDALAARVAAGDTSAFDDFAEISQQLLDIERQLFGSTQAYFDRLQQVTALTERAIVDQTNVSSINPSAPAIMDERATINRAIDVQTNELATRLDAINQNLIALAPGVQAVAVGGGGGRADFNAFPSLIANF
jgi:hypothetical protein